MTGSFSGSATPTPSDLSPVPAVQPSDGLIGDVVIDEAFSQLDEAARTLLADSSARDARDSISAAQHFNEVLHRRLDQASE